MRVISVPGIRRNLLVYIIALGFSMCPLRKLKTHAFQCIYDSEIMLVRYIRFTHAVRVYRALSSERFLPFEISKTKYAVVSINRTAQDEREIGIGLPID